jgi:hypothetical protein
LSDVAVTSSFIVLFIIINIKGWAICPVPSP